MLLKSSAHKPADLVVIDSVFPQKEPYAFRNAEINEYFKRLKNFKSYTMSPVSPPRGAPFSHDYGISYKEFLANRRGYLKHYSGAKSRIQYLWPRRKYSFGMSYSFFLAETYVLLPFYEKNKIPFTFVLYPGGMFGLDSAPSDEMLREIFSSKFFKGVIVTQKITMDYLLRKKLCPHEKISFIYGGFVQFKADEVKPKQLFGKDKPTFDICFVAAKYSDKGVDKGYDLFIETAKRLCAQTKDIMFHVVGGFDESEIDISQIRSRVKFYGYKKPDFLLDFYSRMDIFLSPNRPFQLFGGNFDGFPLGIDAGYCGVALFVADELKMNNYYRDGEEIIILPLKTEAIEKKVIHYYHNPEELYSLAHKGQLVTQKLFDINYQVGERIKVFNKYVNLEHR